MNRRELLAMAGALGLSPAFASAVQAAEGDAAAARDAYLYALPLIEMATTRARLLKTPGAAINTLTHTRTLSDHKARWVTTPRIGGFLRVITVEPRRLHRPFPSRPGPSRRRRRPPSPC